MRSLFVLAVIVLLASCAKEEKVQTFDAGITLATDFRTDATGDTTYAIFMPSGFTPNGDGVNDLFTIKSTGVKEISLDIFNRWGEKLYEFTGANAAWDGKTGQGAKVPDGTYFYFVKATGYDGNKVEKHGTVNLYR